MFLRPGFEIKGWVVEGRCSVFANRILTLPSASHHLFFTPTIPHLTANLTFR
jgi:hypothetical protein